MAVTAATGAVRVGVGRNHTCFLVDATLKRGTIWCAGVNQFGELGNGRYDAGSTVLTRVMGIGG